MTRTVVSLVVGVLLVVGGWAVWHTRTGDGDGGGSGLAVDSPKDVSRDTRPTEATPRGSKIVPGRSQADGRTGTGPSGDGATGSGGSAPGGGSDPRPLATDDTEPGVACGTPAPTSADGWNATFRGMDRLPTLQGGDHGASVALADGRRLFVFGDTIRAKPVQPFMVRNSIMLAQGGCLQAMPVEGDGAVIPARGDISYWPMSLRAVPADGGTTVQVITLGVRKVGQSGKGQFETTGSGLATFEVPTGRTPRLVRHVPLGPSSTDPRVPTWGAALTDSGGHLYVWGTASNATKSTAGWSLRVARTTPDQLASPASWEYWDGSSWVRGRPSAAQGPDASLVPADGGVSHILSVVERGGSWYAVSKAGDYFGDTLTVWKAPSPTGPFTEHDVRGLANDSRIRRYMPLVHGDAQVGSGRLLVSWSESPQTSAPYFSNPELYRPRFGEISLP